MKTKAEILEDFGCPTPDFHENVTMFYPAIHSAMDEYAQQTAMEFAEWLHNNCSALCGNLWELGKYPNSQACTTAELFAKFEAERNQNGG